MPSLGSSKLTRTMTILLKKIKEKIDQLLELEFIHEIEHMEWVSPIIAIPKKKERYKYASTSSKSMQQP